ncbi:major allergen Pru ar 1-like [Vitis riparia]|uniref:major allergen Pru ar 1-like n=1 Tax=Vitis riparia TaxID=96939 RepID=UPI00155B083C|nr:major allergen Pru ar 1-like [Vitis riparia]
MGVVTYEHEITSSIPPAKMFKAFILDSDNLIPKILPQAIKCVEIIEGDGGPGSIKKITFGEGSQFNYVKHRVDGIDKENFTYSYSVIEGDALMGTLESISYEVKLVASPNGGTMCKSTSKYHTKGDFEITENQIKAGKEKAKGLFKAVEAYLLANPDAY